jgi:hypothetical protein
LREKLELHADGKPGYEEKKSIILFTFRADDNGADGIAARVYVMRDTGTADELVSDTVILQNRGLNGSMVGQNATAARNDYTTAELMALVKAGFGEENLVHANMSYVSSDTWMKLLLSTFKFQGCLGFHLSERDETDSVGFPCLG